MNNFPELLNEAASAWWNYLLLAGWQSALVALALLALVAIGRRWPSPLRYGLLLIALLKFAAPPLVTAPWSVFAPAEAPRVESAAPSAIASTRLPTTLRPGRIPMVRVRMSESSPVPNAPIGGAAPSPVAQDPGAVVATLHWNAWLMLIHLGGVIAVLAWIGLQVQHLRRAIRSGVELTDPAILKSVEDLTSLLGLRRKPRVVILKGDFSPAAFGVLSPTILLPASLLQSASPTALRTVLAHELAHFRRGDLLVNWLQLVLQAVWWFNPIYALLSRKIRQTREDCCDDLLLARGVVSGEVCCEALLEAAGSLGGRQPIGAALGFAERLHPLGRRLKRLMDPRLVRRPGISREGLLGLAVLAFLFLPGARTPMTGTSQPLPPGPQWTESRNPVPPNTDEPAIHRLEGIVIDEEGQGVSGATVKALRTIPEETVETTTDQGGRFTLEGLKQRVFVETTSEEHAPNGISIHFVSPTQEIRIELIRGYPIRLQVVDTEGKPIPDVRVTISGGGISGRVRYTDREGRFVWDNAPFEMFSITLEKPGYYEGYENLRPSKEERKIVLEPALKISGVVTDAETGEPIPKFLAVQGRSVGGSDPLAWDESENSVEGVNGAFVTIFSERRRSLPFVRIDAEGYAPAILGPFTPEEGDRHLEVRLERPRPLRVTIRTPEGEPASGARIGMTSLMRGALTLVDGRTEFLESHPRPVSDENGEVDLGRVADTDRLVLFHESGVATRKAGELRDQDVINLESWGRIEGRTRKGPNPDPNVSINLLVDDHLNFFSTIQSNAEGRFIIETIPPGDYRLAKLNSANQGLTSWSQVEVVQVAPGETVEVSLGGKGRPVVGRIEVPEPWKESFNPERHYGTFLHSFPPPESLKRLREQNPTGGREQIMEWNLSLEGREYRRKSTTTPFEIEPDGSFRIEDVQPGECRITLVTLIRGSNPHDLQQAHFSLHHDFTVPEFPSERTDEPLDLGVLPVRIRQVAGDAKTGDPFPDLTLHRGESETVRIEDLRGKVVVLAFWTEGMSGRPADDRWRETLAELAGMESTEESPVCLHVHLSRFKPESLSPPPIHPGVIEAHLFGEEWDAAVRSTPGIDVGALLVLDRSGKILLRDSHPAEVLRVVKSALANP